MIGYRPPVLTNTPLGFRLLNKISVKGRRMNIEKIGRPRISTWMMMAQKMAMSGPIYLAANLREEVYF